MKHVTVVSCQLNNSMSKEMNKFNLLRDFFFPHIWSLSLTLFFRFGGNGKENYSLILLSVYLQMCMLFNVSKLKKPKSILYKAELSLPEHFDIPKTVLIPQIPETQVELAQYQGNESAEKTGNQ